MTRCAPSCRMQSISCAEVSYAFTLVELEGQTVRQAAAAMEIPKWRFQLVNRAYGNMGGW